MRLLPHTLKRPAARWKQTPVDFHVEELPAYPVAGEGEHLYIEVTRQDMTTPYLIKQISQALGISSGGIGYAGLKDRCAVATQRFSLEGLKEIPSAPSIEGVLDWKTLGWHPHKLRRGHLQGNRFRMNVELEDKFSDEKFEEMVQVVTRTGWANYYGEQRFGRGGDNHEHGLAKVLGGRGKVPALAVNALQSHLFNEYLERRIRLGGFASVFEGDVCAHLPEGGMFELGSEDDLAREQHRVEQFETSPTGPIFGYKMRAATGQPGSWENQVLQTSGVELEQFRRVKAPGSRRRLRLALGDERTAFRWRDLSSPELPGSRFELTFTLPAGSYATVLVSHFFQSAGAPHEEELAD